MNQTADNIFLTEQELADRWKITVSGLIQRRSAGTLPFLKIGRAIRYRLSDIQEIENKGIRNATNTLDKFMSNEEVNV